MKTDAMILALDVAISALYVDTSALCNDCRVGVTLQMCNRVTDPWDIGVFSRPAYDAYLTFVELKQWHMLLYLAFNSLLVCWYAAELF